MEAFSLSFFFFLFRPTPVAYGGSQARGSIGATAAGLHIATATQDPSRTCDLYHSSRQCRMFNPLSKARDQTRNHMVPSRIPFCCATIRTPAFSFFSHFWLRRWYMELQDQGSEPQSRPKPQLQQHWILNPLCWTVTRTRIPGVSKTSPILLHHSGSSTLEAF